MQLSSLIIVGAPFSRLSLLCIFLLLIVYLCSVPTVDSAWSEMSVVDETVDYYGVNGSIRISAMLLDHPVVLVSFLNLLMEGSLGLHLHWALQVDGYLLILG